MTLPRSASILALSCLPFLLIAACGSGGGGDKTITLDGQIVDFLLRNPVVGAEVCILGRADIACDETDDQGNYTLTGVPAKARIHGAVSKQGFLSMLIPLATTESDMSLPSLYLFTPAEADILAGAISVTIEAGKGIMLYNAQATAAPDAAGVAGIALGLSPASGDGPFYADEEGNIDLQLTGTGSNGLGGYLNLDAGDYTLTASGGTCAPLYGWEATAGAGTMDVLIQADTITVLGQVCQ